MASRDSSPIIITPAPLPGPWKASTIERHELGSEIMFAVATRRGGGSRFKREWFGDRRLALAHALAVADRYEIPVLDLAGEQSDD